MVNKDYVRYFREGMAKGLDLDYLKETLLFRGYMRYEVDAALDEAKSLGPLDEKKRPDINKRINFEKKSERFKHVIFGIVGIIILVLLIFVFTSTSSKIISYDELQEGVNLDLKKGSLGIEIENDRVERLILNSVKEDAIKGNFLDVDFYIKIGGSKDFDYDDDKRNDINIRLVGINGKIPNLRIESLKIKKIIEKTNDTFDESIVSVWNEIVNEGECSFEILSERLVNCSSYKCGYSSSDYDDLYGSEAYWDRGIVGSFEGVCYYYEKYPSDSVGGVSEMYCSYSEEIKNKFSQYYIDKFNNISSQFEGLKSESAEFCKVSILE